MAKTAKKGTATVAKTAKKGTATAVKSTTFKVSVLRCRKTGRVLFLEAGKDFVDTLFSFLLLPVGTIIHMLSKGVEVKPLGGISSIFESVEKLDCSFLHVDKKNLLQPRPAITSGSCESTGLLQGLDAAKIKRPTEERIELPTVYYRCNNCDARISSTQGTPCDACFETNHRSYICNQPLFVLPKDLQSLKAKIIEKIIDEDQYVDEATCSSAQGFVRENITYMVTDHLEVMPSTTIRSIKVLNKLKVATLADLESSDIIVSITQILQLLQSALTSNSCLNDVFGKK